MLPPPFAHNVRPRGDRRQMKSTLSVIQLSSDASFKTEGTYLADAPPLISFFSPRAKRRHTVQPRVDAVASALTFLETFARGMPLNESTPGSPRVDAVG